MRAVKGVERGAINGIIMYAGECFLETQPCSYLSTIPAADPHADSRMAACEGPLLVQAQLQGKPERNTKMKDDSMLRSKYKEMQITLECTYVFKFCVMRCRNCSRP